MSAPPFNPKIYHITHADNLPSIIATGSIGSDAQRIRQGLANTNIGMTEIKRRRLALAVSCCSGTTVGEYVPFYFCPRSIMLFLIHRGNHPDLPYRGGQRPIVHLEADLNRVVQWAEPITGNGHSARATLERITQSFLIDSTNSMRLTGQR